MDRDESRDRHPDVPAPRSGGRDLGGGGDAWFPLVPAPRAAPLLESLAPTRPVRTLAAPRPPRSAELVVVPRAELVPAPRPAGGLLETLRSWATSLVNAVTSTATSAWALVTRLVPATS